MMDFYSSEILNDILNSTVSIFTFSVSFLTSSSIRR